MPKQKEFEGMERPSGDKELDALAVTFKKSSKKRRAAQDNELNARGLLIEKMREKKLTVYENRDEMLLVTLRSKEEVKVVDIDETEPDDDDEEIEDGKGAAYAEMAEQKATKKKQNSVEA